ncbi:hypothetical protein [Streptomyces vastus]|uniref:Uncharacterized protein n=1 Tax=Streptomyces vastus TaxID=285451 RepID=A0ABP6CZE5_9ACTN
MIQIRWALPLRWGLALSGWLAVAVTLLPDAGALRVVVTTVFMLVCPGLAAARWAWPAASRGAGWTVALEAAALAVVLSMSLSLIAVEPFYLSGTFTTTRVLIALAVVTSGLALFPRTGEARPWRPRAAPDGGLPTDTHRPRPSSQEGGGGTVARGLLGLALLQAVHFFGGGGFASRRLTAAPAARNRRSQCG